MPEFDRRRLVAVFDDRDMVVETWRRDVLPGRGRAVLMPSSRRPRKAHRPRPVARPVMAGMQRDLVQSPRLAITALERATDHEALESARHTLAVFMSYMAASVERAGFELGPVPAGMRARASNARPGRNCWRCAMPWTSATPALPRLATAVLMHALLRVYDVYDPVTHSNT